MTLRQTSSRYPSTRWLFFFLIALASSAAESFSSVATLSTLAAFNGDNGSSPFSGLVPDAAGNFYGTTDAGGTHHYGTIFRFDVVTNTLTTLASFDGSNGVGPRANLLFDASGKFYGTTYRGGAGGWGSVFRFDVSTNTITSLASFNINNGASPIGGLVADAAGRLYGTTSGEGASSLGTLFRVDTGANTLTTLVSFDGFNGVQPRATLLFDAAGNLYGTTSGQTGNRGTVFKFDIGTLYLTTLVNFSPPQGSRPHSGLVADAAGFLYGTTTEGGSGGLGTVFRLNLSDNSLTTLASFNGANGVLPSGNLLLDAAGNIYGTTQIGGTNNYGTVFRIDAETYELITLISFSGDNGAYPQAGLIADSSGNLYGTTGFFGPGGKGTIFRLSNTGFVVPEPATLVLWSAAGLWLFGLGRRRAIRSGLPRQLSASA